ncbi:hypothetical protein [Proteus sp. CD3]|uniref:hypothetical protein n=1 Tax=Proteus sp. CD3 TaxID=1921565 RepID=UPI00124A1221|nr:hypothetical protein [Proteus sp. CD3]
MKNIINMEIKMITKIPENLNKILDKNDTYKNQADNKFRLTSEQALAILIAAAPQLNNLPKAPYHEAAGKKFR